MKSILINLVRVMFPVCAFAGPIIHITTAVLIGSKYGAWAGFLSLGEVFYAEFYWLSEVGIASWYGAVFGTWFVCSLATLFMVVLLHRDEQRGKA